MATAEQIKALLKSHVDRDDQRFFSIALQVAAKEARQGHHKLANDIKNLVDKNQKTTSSVGLVEKRLTPFVKQPDGDLKGFLSLGLFQEEKFFSLVLPVLVRQCPHQSLLQS